MKTKLSYLAMMYAMAIMSMIVCVFIKDIEINGQMVGVLGRAFCGFLFGMALEAMLAMVVATYGILANKINLD